MTHLSKEDPILWFITLYGWYEPGLIRSWSRGRGGGCLLLLFSLGLWGWLSSYWAIPLGNSTKVEEEVTSQSFLVIRNFSLESFGMKNRIIDVCQPFLKYVYFVGNIGNTSLNTIIYSNHGQIYSCGLNHRSQLKTWYLTLVYIKPVAIWPGLSINIQRCISHNQKHFDPQTFWQFRFREWLLYCKYHKSSNLPPSQNDCVILEQR